MSRKTFELIYLNFNYLDWNFRSLAYVFVRVGFKPQWIPTTFDPSEPILCVEELLDEVAMRVREPCA